MDLRTIGLLVGAAGLAAAGTPAVGQNYLGHGDRSRYRNPSAYSPASVVVGPRGSNQRAGDLRDQLWFNNQRSHSNSTGMSAFRPYVSYTPASSQRFAPPPMPRTFVASPTRSTTVRSEPRSGTEFSAESWSGMNRSNEPQAREARRIRAYSEPSWQSSFEETAAAPSDGLFPQPERGSPGPAEPREFISPAWPSVPPPIDPEPIRPATKAVGLAEEGRTFVAEAPYLPIAGSNVDPRQRLGWTERPPAAERSEPAAANAAASPRTSTEGMRLHVYLSAGARALAASDFVRAEDCFTRILMTQPDQLNARIGRAEALLGSAKHSEARADLTHVLRAHPGWFESPPRPLPAARIEALTRAAGELRHRLSDQAGADGFEAAALLAFVGCLIGDVGVVDEGVSAMSARVGDANDPRAELVRPFRSARSGGATRSE